MKRTVLLLLIAFVCSMAATAQNNPKMDYKKEWEKIDKLKNESNLPKSTLVEVVKVYNAALNEKEYGQLIKAIIYRMNCQGLTEENTAVALINSLKKDAEQVPQPAKSLIYSLIGDMYKGFYQYNQWQLSERTRVAVVDDDMNTWDISRLFEEALKYYHLSIQDEKTLQQIPLSNFNDVLKHDGRDSDAMLLLPTLYDFLVYRTIDALKGELAVSLPQQTFVLNKPEYFADARTFVGSNIKTADTLSAEYQTILLYQKIIKFRLQQVDKKIPATKEVNDLSALISIDIDRLKYVQSKGNYSNNDQLYENSLAWITAEYGDKPEQAVYAIYELAVLYKGQGNEWRSTKNDKFRTKYNDAYNLCSQIIAKCPETTIGRHYAKELQKEIEAPTAQLIIERVQYPNSPILALVNYRNVNKLYVYVYKLTDKQEGEMRNDGAIDFSKFENEKPYSTQTIDVLLQPDYQPYSAEIKVDALPQGFYAAFISNLPELPKKGDTENYSEKLISSAVFQVSPLNMIIRGGDNRLFGKAATQLSKKAALTQVYVANSQTGEPVKNAKVDVYTERYVSGGRGSGGKYVETFEGSYHTDSDGIAYLPELSGNRYFKKAVITSKTERLVVFNLNRNYWSRNDERMSEQLVFFTDRSIYRPGQTVYYKGLYLKTNGDGNNQLIPKAKITVHFNDVNYKSVASQDLVTNEYGTIQGSFTIPQGLLNGRMTLISPYGSTNIQVEEYKRPTFEVKFDPVKQNYSLNSEVEVSGLAKALAGYAVDNSKVQYRVVRNAQYRFYRWWYPQIGQPSREIASGEVTTDTKGAFTVKFKAEADDIKNDELIYNYVVTADITDANGETRSSTLSVKIGKKPLLIAAAIPTNIMASDSLIYSLTTTNLNGDFTPANVTVTVTALKSPDEILRSRLWSVPDTLAMPRGEFKKNFPLDAYGDEDMPQKYPVLSQLTSVTINTNNVKKVNLSALKNAKTGWYRIDIKAKNDNGVEVDQQNYITLISAKPEPITNMTNWLKVIKDTGEPGESAEFWVAGGEKKSYVYYEVLLKNGIIEKKSIVVGTTPERIIIPIKEEYRGGFAVQFVMLQNSRTYKALNEVNVPYTNKQLDVAFTTFRDKLLPGEKEKWTLTIKNKEGEKEMAEMAAALYDASLDVFRPHGWSGNSNFYSQRNHYYFNWQTPEYSQIKSTQYHYYSEHRASIYKALYPYLNMFGHNYTRAFYSGINQYSSILMRGTATGSEEIVEQLMGASRGKRSSKGTVAIVAVDESPSSAIYGSRAAGGDIKTLSLALPEEADGDMVEQPQLTEIATRQNFNETAFFYPQLRTNEDGEIIIDFTIPEALTRWKMLGFAHTKDFKVGSTTNELITQKQVAISANAPRFFRESDVIEFTAKVNNITEADLSGQAMLRLFDAVTMQPIDAQIIRTPQTQSFSAKAGESAGVKWTLAIPAGIQAISYKVTAQAGSHTDGEEKIVPVMTNSMLVTETMPFNIRAGEQKEFTFKRLKENKSTTLRNHKLTLEFTSNPAWYAIQAMPYLMEYPYECAEQVFSRFYANSLASTVVNSSPRVKQVFDMWRTLPENKDALLSNLEKNQELKQVMLEETPWVMQAENETERKKRVGLLFDLNRMGDEQQRAFTKLKKAQSSNGGFPWFAGSPESRFITQHIVAGIEHLRVLKALDSKFENDALAMAEGGLAFLDYSVRADYDNLVKTPKIKLDEQHVSAIQLHYLYACSFSEHKPQNKQQLEAFEYYYNQATKYWMNFNVYTQAMTSLAMNRFGNKELAMKIINSLKERAQQSSEMGMYWKDNVAGYFWYQAPIETQAMLIEAFNEVAKDTKSVEEMKIWLLRNKQTNDWRTTKATAEACFALLMTGSNLLDESKPLEITIGGIPLAQATKEDIRPEPGTGYVKTAWNGSDVTDNMAALNVTNPNKSGIAWGGVYWQYFEQLDKITSAETNLRMNKQLFLKKITERGAELLPLSKDNVLKVGDIVTVRMELRADRDYEYVHLKDMRAAGFEPTKAVSGYRYRDGLGYYESIKDASTNFFITQLRKGTYVFEYELRVTHAGEFSNGVTTFQCMYAPEFSAHSEGVRVNVEQQ